MTFTPLQGLHQEQVKTIKYLEKNFSILETIKSEVLDTQLMEDLEMCFINSIFKYPRE